LRRSQASTVHLRTATIQIKISVVALAAQLVEEEMAHLQWLTVALGVMVSVMAALHALFHKREPRSAFAWVAICLMWPLAGALLYLIFGKNRIQTRARKLHGPSTNEPTLADYHSDVSIASRVLRTGYQGLALLSATASARPLLTGNVIDMLINGEEAYPAMLAAIDQASKTVYLGTYIFDGDGIGQRFIDSLVAAQKRGVEVRVLIDGVGRLYSFIRAAPRLKQGGVAVALYLPPRLFPPKITINMRNHRKILVVDGQQAFTGGMNIRQHHMTTTSKKRHATEDIHFRLQGPVAQQLQNVFVADWRFASNIAVDPLPYRLPASNEGACCRVIADGPNDDIDQLTRVLVAAIGTASESIAIMTPYFLPSRELDLALQLAALRGIRVQILLPGKNNMPFVNWAAFHTMDQMIDAGVEFYLYAGPFIHSKLIVVDDYYTQIGSSNLDPRSLRLNFEVVVEIYNDSVSAQLAGYFSTALATSRPITAKSLAQRSAPAKFAGAVFWLLSPYL
jgi:cardiolipin synthase